MKHLIFSYLIVSLAISCNSKEQQRLSEIRWIGEKIDGKKIQLQRQDEKIYIKFDTLNRVTGRAGCNRFSGVYKIEGKGKIVFSDIVTTKMTCPDIHIEALFFRVLENTDSFTLRRNQLRLKGNGSTIAVFFADTGNDS